MVTGSKSLIAAKLVVMLLLLSAAWTVIASLVFLAGTRLLGRFHQPFYQWWLYLWYGRDNAAVALWLKIGAGVASAVLVVFVAALAVRGWKIGPSIRPRLFGGRSEPMRGRTDNHGHADWLPIAKAQALFPGPHAEYGGLVVGEAYRVDQDVQARKVGFDPDKPATWGRGGKAPLLVDPCVSGPTHSLIVAGAGSFKSMCAVSTLLTWTGSAVVLDPACELGQMLGSARTAMGHEVYQMDLWSGVGFNVLEWIDIAAPTATTNVLSVVSWICGDVKPHAADKTSEFFDARGRALVACLLCHMLWDPDLAPELKTLATLRRGVSVPEPEMRAVLGSIHANSASPLARSYAGTLMGLVDETFSGVYANADEHTAWLANPAFAGIVSADNFRASDLLTGKVSVFLQLPLPALQTTPALARCVIGALLNAAYEADGRVNGRILYLLDEAARLGPMKILEVARDAGRKYGITLQLLYQSVGQIEAQWGRDGKRSWYDGVSHRTYAAVQDLETAKELEESFGAYGVMATSEGSNSGSSGKAFEAGSRSRGAGLNFSEMSRPLIRKDELMSDIRIDEAFVIVRGSRPLRCGRAIYFRRPEMAERVATTRFKTNVVPAGR
jgi:type IV secretion system protein VirD4